MNVCQFATGTSTAYRSMTIPNYVFWRHTYWFTNLILFVPKNISWFYITYLVALDDDNLVISGYNLVRSSHPSNTKPRSLCLYYTNYLPLRVLSIIYLNECLKIKLTIGDKSCNFVASYRSSSQSKDNSEAFLIILKWKVLF